MSAGVTPRAVADAMLANDRASRALGMEIGEVGDGHARLSMTVTEDMLNGHGICHGGMVFALADSAFAFASNSGNRVVVAAGCDIAYVRPARLGERLMATARRRLSRGRTCFYDIEVANPDGETVALFRGRGRQLDGEVVPSGTEPPGGAGDKGEENR